MYKINGAGEVAHHSMFMPISWLPRALLCQSTAGPHCSAHLAHSLLWMTGVSWCAHLGFSATLGTDEGEFFGGNI